jgi:FtsH-binding integral membrane protein
MQPHTSHAKTSDATQYDEGLRAHMQQVYHEMSYALGITGLVAWFLGQDLKSAMAGSSTLLPSSLISGIYQSPLIWLFMFAPLIMIFFFGKVMRDSSASGARKFLYAFSVLMGVSTATIFVKYTGISIAQCFFATAGAFGALSLWGYTTKKDISGWGSFLFIGLIGIIIAMIINIFLDSSALAMTISVIGILIFAGLTAHDTQKIKTGFLECRGHLSDDELSKIGTSGALNLYLDFMNLFMMLLSLFGNSD